MKTIRESECVFDALSEQELCPVIQEMADRIAEELDLCAEFDFEYGKEDVIVGLSREFYRRGAFREGVGLLLLSFSLIENGEAAMMLDVLLSTPGDDVPKLFLECFLRRYANPHIAAVIMNPKGKMIPIVRFSTMRQVILLYPLPIPNRETHRKCRW